jgi:hypothetical protein
MTFPEYDARRQILNRATVAVEQAARDGGVIKATVEARRIIDECIAGDALTLNEVAEDIARLATERGLVVDFG